MARTADEPSPGPGWLVGAGVASSLHETAPPTEHISEAWVTLGDDLMYELAVGTVEFGEGTSTAHVQIAANQLGTTPSRIRLVQSDTDRTGFDTGAFASAGLFVAGNAVLRAANAVRDRILDFAAAHTGVHRRDVLDGRRRCRLRRHGACRWPSSSRRPERAASGSPPPARPTAHPAASPPTRRGSASPSTAVTGEIRILYSVQATDAGVVINPAQVRGQVEGGVAQGIGFALTENSTSTRTASWSTRTSATTASPPTPISPAPRCSWWTRRIPSGPCGRRGWRSAASTRWPPRWRTRSTTPRASATARCP